MFGWIKDILLLLLWPASDFSPPLAFSAAGHLSFYGKDDVITLRKCWMEPRLASNTREIQSGGNRFSSFTPERAPEVRPVRFMRQYTDDGLKKTLALTAFIGLDSLTVISVRSSPDCAKHFNSWSEGVYSAVSVKSHLMPTDVVSLYKNQ